MKRYRTLFLAAVAMALIGRPRLVEADLDWLATYSGFIQGAMSLLDQPIVLDGWQSAIVDNPAKFIIGAKTRQGGWSFGVCAARALAKSMLVPRNLSVLVSNNLDDAREKVRYARDLYSSLPSRLRSRLITDNKFELEFANGSRIVTMFMPRGKGPADVFIDEMAFMKRAREIYQAAVFMTLRGGQIVIGSTILAKAGMFYEILSGAEGKFQGFARYSVPWWECSALCRYVPRAILEAPAMTTHERVHEFGTDALIQIFENTYIADFQQECELRPGDDEESFFPIDLIFQCVDPDLVAHDNFEDFKKSVKGPIHGGYDVGRRKNPSELILLEQLGDKFYQRMNVTMRNKSFDEQKFILTQALEMLPIVHLAIDETGIGMNLAEDLARRFPHIVMAVNFSGRVDADARKTTDASKKETVAIKERMATDMRITYERRLISMPQDRELIQQIHSVKRETTALGGLRYSIEQNEHHHGDKFWAQALAIFAANSVRRMKTGLTW